MHFLSALSGPRRKLQRLFCSHNLQFYQELCDLGVSCMIFVTLTIAIMVFSLTCGEFMQFYVISATSCENDHHACMIHGPHPLLTFRMLCGAGGGGCARDMFKGSSGLLQLSHTPLWSVHGTAVAGQTSLKACTLVGGCMARWDASRATPTA